MRQPGEPSVEEILDSIKQVMARDHRAFATGQPVPAAEDSDDGVLDLGAMRRLGAQPQPAPGPGAPPLVTETASASMRGSLEALAMVADQPRTADGSAADSPWEAMVRELLRPALADWLDRNLPPIVERLVAAEIARIVGKR